MPHPYPGQQWKHGWKPLTPGAVKSKNHGKKPAPGSKLAKGTSDSKSPRDSSPTDSQTTSQRMDDAIRARAGRSNGASGSSSLPSPGSRTNGSNRGRSGPSGGSIARDALTRKNGSERSARMDEREAAANRNATPLRKEALEREASNPYGKGTIARDPDNIKIGQTVWAGNKWVKARTAQEAKDLSRLAKRHLDDLHSQPRYR
ncbi:hypothetical protein [Streptosporangium sp. CA-115845]|uniref:hypothetical protein n=1 Tax=Streptosporangium sp. CA-115845 TaxID=3240071 RepID=UPI003D90EEAA